VSHSSLSLWTDGIIFNTAAMETPRSPDLMSKNGAWGGLSRVRFSGH